MTQAMDARIKEFQEMKENNRQVVDRCKGIHEAASKEVLRLRNLVKNLEDNLKQKSQSQVNQMHCWKVFISLFMPIKPCLQIRLAYTCKGNIVMLEIGDVEKKSPE